MEAVSLTSTSTLVRSPPPHGTPRSSKSRAKSAVKSSSLANGPAVIVGSNRDGAPKPKQSKSRNGRAIGGSFLRHVFGPANIYMCMLTHFSARLRYVQAKTFKMRRDEAKVSAMLQEECGV
jgi:hypothetical protein